MTDEPTRPLYPAGSDPRVQRAELARKEREENEAQAERDAQQERGKS
jgi:hypothetical protein